MPLADATKELLSVYMTPAGLAAALQEFSDTAITTVITHRGDNLLLAAADLLDGLPQASAGGGGLASFKLDVLEFKYASGSNGVNWSTLAANLRERAASGGGRVGSASFEPLIEPWGIG